MKRVFSFIIAAALLFSPAGNAVIAAQAADSSSSASSSNWWDEEDPGDESASGEEGSSGDESEELSSEDASSEDDSSVDASPEDEGGDESEEPVDPGADPSGESGFEPDSGMAPPAGDVSFAGMEGDAYAAMTYVDGDTFSPNPVWARVSAVLLDDGLASEQFPGKNPESIVFEAVVQEGELSGTTVSAVQKMDEVTSQHFIRPVREGDAVYLTLYRDDAGAVRGSFSDFRRTPALAAAIAAVLVLLLLCCHRKAGFKMVLSMLAACALIPCLYIPLLSAGLSPIPAAVVTGAVILLLSSVLIYGIKYRTLAASAGGIIAVSIVGMLVQSCENLLRISGIANLQMLEAYYSKDFARNLDSVWIAGVMFACTGALIVIANTVAAGAEPTDGVPDWKRAYSEGYRHGAAALTPLVLTLGFAGLGFALGGIVLLTMGGMPGGRIFSDELVTVELTRLLAAILGLLLCVPCTAGICALLLRVRTRADGSLREFHIKEALLRRQQAVFGQVADKIDRAARQTRQDALQPDAAAAQPPREEDPAPAPDGGEPDAPNNPAADAGNPGPVLSPAQESAGSTPETADSPASGSVEPDTVLSQPPAPPAGPDTDQDEGGGRNPTPEQDGAAQPGGIPEDHILRPKTSYVWKLEPKIPDGARIDPMKPKEPKKRDGGKA